MTTNHIETYKDLQKSFTKLAKNCPDVINSFGGLHKEATKDGALSLKTKELIALGIAIVVRCSGCIDSHVHSAIAAGATREEIAETVGVAILMGGGPSTVYGSQAIEAMEQFLEK